MTERREAIRKIIISALLVSGLAWLGPVVPGKEWLGSFGVEGLLMIALFGLLGCILYLHRSRKNGTQPVTTARQTG